MNMTTKTLFAAAVAGLAFAGSASAALIPVASYVYDGAGGEAAGAQPSTFLTNFADTGTAELTDGFVVTTGGFDQAGYVGFRDLNADDGTSQPQVTFDFGSLYDVSTIDVSYRDVEGTIQEPDAVFISVSSNGVDYSTPVSFGPFVGTGGSGVTTTLDVSGLADARYYRLDFRQDVEWLLLSEVAFDGTAVPEPGSLALLGLGGLCVLRRRRG